jgi:hypothetical protein
MSGRDDHHRLEADRVLFDPRVAKALRDENATRQSWRSRWGVAGRMRRARERAIIARYLHPRGVDPEA